MDGSEGLAALMKLLEADYGPRVPDTYRAQLRSIRRRPKETPIMLRDRIAALVRYAFPQESHSSRERMIKDHFMDSLATPLRQTLVGRSFTTIDELVATVEQYEAIGQANINQVTQDAQSSDSNTCLLYTSDAADD